MAKVIETEQRQLNNIGAGTSIKGDIDCSGDIRIDGTLVGNLKVQGKVVIGTTGTINGEISCKNAQIEGKVEGKVNVLDLLTLKSTSSIEGDIITKQLSIEPGAVFTGTCNMKDATNSSLNEKSKK